MENNCNIPYNHQIFEQLYEVIPDSFDNVILQIKKIIEQNREELKIAKMFYKINQDEDVPFSFQFPAELDIYNSGTDSDENPYIFSFPFHVTKNIDYIIYVDKNCNRDKEYDILMKYFSRMIYSIFNSMSLRRISHTFMLTDSETSIPNQRAFLQFAKNVINNNDKEKYTALYFNIRNFKSVHKSLTYVEGNEIIADYCETVASAVTKKEIVAYLGCGNLVAVILNSNMDYFLDLIQNMIVKYQKGYEKFSFSFGATIGAARMDNANTSSDVMTMINSAYQSARESRASLKYFDSKANAERIERKIILSKFNQSLRNKEFFVVFQPKVDIKTKTLIGAEALARWKNNGEMMMPGIFIPVLENDGCITKLDFYVLEEVCRFQQKMAYAGIERVKISINFSRRHLTNSTLVEEIAEVIDKYNVPHNLILIELTESEDFRDYGVMQKIVNELNLLGIQSSIDDFGTGYSSLSMLKSLKIDELKIDRSLIPVSKINTEYRSIVMLEGVVNLAKSLGLTIVAEGVETPEQLRIIENVECDIVQGYIFDKPLPEYDFIKRLENKFYGVL